MNFTAHRAAHYRKAMHLLGKVQRIIRRHGVNGYLRIHTGIDNNGGFCIGRSRVARTIGGADRRG